MLQQWFGIAIADIRPSENIPWVKGHSYLRELAILTHFIETEAAQLSRCPSSDLAPLPFAAA